MPAVTRNMKKVSEHNATYDVVIDFDDASEEWKKNKISIGNGMYKTIVYFFAFLPRLPFGLLAFWPFQDDAHLGPMRWPLSARLPENFASSPSELLPPEDMR